eukprot:9130-Hanusia_phi.AAC.1
MARPAPRPSEAPTAEDSARAPESRGGPPCPAVPGLAQCSVLIPNFGTSASELGTPAGPRRTG